MQQFPPSRGGDERGSALLLALVIATLLPVIGLGLTLSTITEFSMSEDFEHRQRALTIAEAGLSASLVELRGIDLDNLSETETEVPNYVGSDQPQDGSHEARNPIPILEARSIDFDSPPARSALGPSRD